MKLKNDAALRLPLPKVDDTFKLREKIYTVQDHNREQGFKVLHINQSKSLQELQPAKPFWMKLPVRFMDIMGYVLNPNAKQTIKQIDFLNNL